MDLENIKREEELLNCRKAAQERETEQCFNQFYTKAIPPLYELARTILLNPEKGEDKIVRLLLMREESMCGGGTIYTQIKMGREIFRPREEKKELTGEDYRRIFEDSLLYAQFYSIKEKKTETQMTTIHTWLIATPVFRNPEYDPENYYSEKYVPYMPNQSLIVAGISIEDFLKDHKTHTNHRKTIYDNLLSFVTKD